MKAHSFFGLAAFTLLACLMLGGGSRPGALSDSMLEILAIPLLSYALWRHFEFSRRPQLFVFAALSAVTLLFAIHLVPLPPTLWAHLTSGEPVVAALRSIDYPLEWRPLSVAPYLTRSSALSSIAPLGIFLATASVDRDARRRLSLAVLATATFSVMLGLAQVAQGGESHLRFFANTNPTEAVGFFANRNHFAAFLYCSIALAAAWLQYSASRGGIRRSKTFSDTSSFVSNVAAATAIVILLSGIAIARSRAGLALAFVALIGAVASAYVARDKTPTTISTGKLLLATIALALTLSVPLSLYRVLARFDADIVDVTRLAIARRTIEAALANLPFGSGMGTFVPVYANFERPQDVLINVYVNHAHDDFLELFLESGIVGAALVLAFAAWWFLNSWRVWIRPTTNYDRTYARAGSVIVLMLALHSLVDYPLRTTAIAALFAFACALMLDPTSDRQSSASLRSE